MIHLMRAKQATPGSRTREAAGFTLIELMVALVIVSILVAIAVPSYTTQTRKSRRTEAKTALLDLASREERFNSTNNAYTSDPAKLGYNGNWPITVGSGYYQLSVCVNNTAASCPATDAGTGSTFVLTATPINSQAKDTQCAKFRIDNTGLQTITGPVVSTQCWN
jgi:type IV pilus assembly protein PilE